MTLEEFRSIFWMEWAHRQLGRGIGLAFALPLTYFAWRGYVRGPLAWKLSAILVGIGLQGALGWYMVKSGLEHDINVPRVIPLHFSIPPHLHFQVSQYRLSAHLGSAFVLYVGMLWVALGLRSKPVDNVALKALQESKRWPAFRAMAAITAALVFITAMSGAFVAGER